MALRRTLCGLALAVIAALGTAPLAAQEMDPAMMQKWMEYATPGDAHKHLAEMAGDWTYTSEMWMAPEAPPMASSGTASFAMAMDGRYLMENYAGDMMGMPFRGHAISGYDNAKKEYFNVWIDNMGTGVMTTTGQWDDATHSLTLTGSYDDPMTGAKDQKVRSVSHHVDADHMTYEMYTTPPGGLEFKTMVVTATRTAPAAAAPAAE